jgi:hypothetical protein
MFDDPVAAAAEYLDMHARAQAVRAFNTIDETKQLRIQLINAIADGKRDAIVQALSRIYNSFRIDVPGERMMAELVIAHLIDEKIIPPQTTPQSAAGAAKNVECKHAKAVNIACNNICATRTRANIFVAIAAGRAIARGHAIDRP